MAHIDEGPREIPTLVKLFIVILLVLSVSTLRNGGWSLWIEAKGVNHDTVMDRYSR